MLCLAGFLLQGWIREYNSCSQGRRGIQSWMLTLIYSLLSSNLEVKNEEKHSMLYLTWHSQKRGRMNVPGSLLFHHTVSRQLNRRSNWHTNRRKCFTGLQHFYKQIKNVACKSETWTRWLHWRKKIMYLKSVLNRESTTFINSRKDFLRYTNAHCKNPYFSVQHQFNSKKWKSVTADPDSPCVPVLLQSIIRNYLQHCPGCLGEISS